MSKSTKFIGKQEDVPAHIDKVERQLLIESERDLLTISLMGGWAIENVVLIEDPLGNFSEQTGAMFG